MSLEIINREENGLLDREAVVTRFYWRDILDNEPPEGSICLVLFDTAIDNYGLIKVKRYIDGNFYPRSDPNELYHSVAFSVIDGYADLLLGSF